MILNLDHLEDLQWRCSCTSSGRRRRPSARASGPGGDRERRGGGGARGGGKSPNGGTVASAAAAAVARTRRAYSDRQPRRRRRTRRHLLHHVVASLRETSAWRYFHVRHTLFCTTLVETSSRVGVFARDVSARQSIFAFLSNSAARRDRFSAATLAAFLAAPALAFGCSSRGISVRSARRDRSPPPPRHPRGESRANSSASAANSTPAPFFFDLEDRATTLTRRRSRSSPRLGALRRNTIRRPRTHVPGGDARTRSSAHLPPAASSAIQSESFAQMVSLARQGTMRCWASSRSTRPCTRGRWSRTTRAHTDVFAATPARGSQTEHSSAVQAWEGERGGEGCALRRRLRRRIDSGGLKGIASGEFEKAIGTSDAPRDIWTRTRWPACAPRPDARHPTSPCRSTCSAVLGAERQAAVLRGGLPCARAKSGYPACDTHVGALPTWRRRPRGDTASANQTSDRARASSRSVCLRTPCAVILWSRLVVSNPLNARRQRAGNARVNKFQSTLHETTRAGRYRVMIAIRDSRIPRITVKRAYVYSFRRDVSRGLGTTRGRRAPRTGTTGGHARHRDDAECLVTHRRRSIRTMSRALALERVSRRRVHDDDTTHLARASDEWARHVVADALSTRTASSSWSRCPSTARSARSALASATRRLRYFTTSRGRFLARAPLLLPATTRPPGWAVVIEEANLRAACPTRGEVFAGGRDGSTRTRIPCTPCSQTTSRRRAYSPPWTPCAWTRWTTAAFWCSKLPMEIPGVRGRVPVPLAVSSDRTGDTWRWRLHEGIHPRVRGVVDRLRGCREGACAFATRSRCARAHAPLRAQDLPQADREILQDVQSEVERLGRAAVSRLGERGDGGQAAIPSRGDDDGDEADRALSWV